MKTPSITNKIAELDSARQMYNTLRGMTIRKVVDMLEEGERGIYTRLAWTARKVEKRWSVMIGLRSNREGALMEHDWNIRTIPEDQLPKGTTAKDAEAQADALRAVYENIENMREAIRFLHLASFRGFAHLEKIAEGGNATSVSSEIRRLEPIFQWHMVRDGFNGPWRFDPLLAGSFAGAEEIDLATMVLREVETPICEVALPAYVYELLGKKDWAGFVEIFGIPDIFFVLPQGTSKDSLTEWRNLLIESFGSGTGFIPPGSDIKTAGGDVRGTNPFAEFCRFQREDVVLAGTGGKLTMLAESGSGTLGGSAQAEVFDRIAKGEARDISECLQRSIDIPFLAEAFPGKPVLAWFEIDCEDAEDSTALVNNVAALAAHGYYVDADQIQERTGLRVTREERPAIEPPVAPPVRNRSANPLKRFALFNRQRDDLGKLKRNAREMIAAATAADLQQIRNRFAEILDTTPDDQLAEAVAAFQRDELPTLAEAALRNPATAVEIENLMVAGLFNGMESAAEGAQ